MPKRIIMNVKIVHIVNDEKTGNSAIFAQNDASEKFIYCFENIKYVDGSMVADMSILTNERDVTQEEIYDAEKNMDDTFIKAMQELSIYGDSND